MPFLVTRALRGLVLNLGAGVRLALGADVGRDAFSFGAMPLAVLWAAVVACAAVIERIAIGPVGGISPWGVSYMLASYFAVVIALQLGAALIGRGAQGARLQIMVLATLPLTYAVVLAITLLVKGGVLPVKAIWGVYGIDILPLVAAVRGTRLLGGRTHLHGLVPAAGFAAATAFGALYLSPTPIFRPVQDTARSEADDWRPVDVETVYYAQPALMDAQLAPLRPGVKGQVELFALLAAYYPDQGVFLREVEAAGTILEDRFGPATQVVRLANSRPEPMRYPLANRRNLEAALNRIGGLMNDGDDVALIYLTSHGSRELISAGYWEVGTSDLGATELAEALRRSGIHNAVVVISACKSGSFIPALEAPDRLVVTAAAADRNSFGCSDTNQWTYFGEAYFDVALHRTRDLAAAFGIAAQQVAEWESAGGQKPSKPQIAEGAEIGKALARLAETAEEPATASVAAGR